MLLKKSTNRLLFLKKLPVFFRIYQIKKIKGHFSLKLVEFRFLLQEKQTIVYRLFLISSWYMKAFPSMKVDCREIYSKTNVRKWLPKFYNTKTVRACNF